MRFVWPIFAAPVLLSHLLGVFTAPWPHPHDLKIVLIFKKNFYYGMDYNQSAVPVYS